MDAGVSRLSFCKKLFQLATVQVMTNGEWPELRAAHTTKMSVVACDVAFKALQMFRSEGDGYGAHELVVCEAMLTFAQHLSTLACLMWRDDRMSIDLLCQEVNTLAEKLLDYVRDCKRQEATVAVVAKQKVQNGQEPVKRKRKCWVQPTLQNRAKYGQFNAIAEMRLNDHDSYFAQMRMTPERFDDLLRRVGPEITKAHTPFRQPISPSEQLALTLRYLAHGESQQQLAVAFRLGAATVCLILKRTLTGIWNVLSDEYLPVPTEDHWTKMEEDFAQKWNFPNCVGAIDGRRVAMHAPNNTGLDTRGLVVMVVCDANHQFTLIDTWASARLWDGEIFWDSTFGKALLEDTVNLPTPKELPGTMDKAPHVFVSSGVFPLCHNIMPPFEGRVPRPEQRVYNYRLSRAHRVAENAFGVLASKWRIFRQPIVANSNTVENIIRATVSLHNYLKASDRGVRNVDHMYCPPGYVDVETEGAVVDGRWRQLVTDSDAVRPINKLCERTSGERSTTIRDAFMSYFNSPCGEVEWQYSCIAKDLGADGVDGVDAEGEDN